MQTNCTDDTSSEISEPLTVVVAPQNDCLAPTNLNAEVEEDVQGYEYMYRVTLTWDQVNNANSYSVYINNDYIQDVNTNSYVVGFDYNITIVFNVSSNCDDGESDLSEPLEVVLGAPCLPPTNLNATVQQDLPEYEYMYKVTLTWDPVDNANSYTVYENNEWKGYATENTYEIGYNEETTVIYTVTSSCELGESEHSEPITVIIQNDAINEYENLFDIYPNPVDNHLIRLAHKNRLSAQYCPQSMGVDTSTRHTCKKPLVVCATTATATLAIKKISVSARETTEMIRTVRKLLRSRSRMPSTTSAAGGRKKITAANTINTRPAP